MITLTLNNMTLLHGNVYRVFFKNTGFNYSAGQYLEILLPGHEPRPFSIANKPGDLLELHIRWLAESPYLVSLIDHIKQNKVLTIQGPLGHCVYHKTPEYPSILIGGGTGFAPLKAIIEQALSEGLKKPMHLYWGARTENDLYLNELPMQWAAQEPLFRYTSISGSERLLQHAVLDDYPTLAQHQVYASGPFDMVHAVFNALKPHGLDPHLIHSDAL
jgi:CDP-4-dehydro-6-deoxyglucose reductase, E3